MSSAEVKDPSYAGEPFIVEHSLQVFRYNADGTGESTLAATVLVQADAAVRQWGLLSFAYASDTQSVQLHYVRVVKPDGTVILTEPASAQDQPTQVTQQAPLYSDLRQLEVPVKGLGVGDRLEYEAVVHTRKAEAPGQFWNALYFERTFVALDERVELNVPVGVAVEVRSGKAGPEIATRDGRVDYLWRATQRKPSVVSTAAPAADLPAKNIPDAAWTTFHDWAAVGAWYRSLQADRVLPDAATRAKAATLVAGATTPQEKLRRIYSFVSMQIRYIGVDFGTGRYQPHTADEVLANGYGDCKDKHTLLAALLAAEGMQADPVLIGAGVDFDKDLAAPNNFNHVITAVTEPDGKRLWLDSTEEVAPPGMLVATLRNKDALLMPAQGAATLVKTPALPPFPAADHYQATGTLTADGKLTGHFTVTLHGDLELLCRMALFGGGPAQWLQIGQGISNAMGFGGTVSAFTPTAVEEPEKPLGYSYDYERDSYGDWEHHQIVPLLPYALFSFGATLTEQPKLPIPLGAPREETAESTLTLPVGFSAPTLPADAHLQSSFASFDLTYSRNGAQLSAKAHMQVRAAELQPSEWEKYNAFIKAVAGTQQFTELAVSQPAAPPASQGPPVALAAGAAEAQANVAQARELLRKGDVAAATKQLDAARLADPKGRGISLLAAVLDGMGGKWEQADADLCHEIALYPDEKTAVLPLLLSIQQKEKRPDAEIATLRQMRAADPQSLSLLRMEALLLSENDRNQEALALLEGAVLRHPGSRPTMVQLGNAEFGANRAAEATAVLEAALDGEPDAGTLNDAAYALADHGVDLPLAAASARKALQLLDAATQTIDLEHLTAATLAQQRLVAETWDTMGWIDYLDGDIAEAEVYLEAAWHTLGDVACGYHLGMVYERKGQLEKALNFYKLATAKETALATRPMPALASRLTALRVAKVHEAAPRLDVDLSAEHHILMLPLLVDKVGDADFYFLAVPGKIAGIRFTGGEAAFQSEGPALEVALKRAQLPARPASSQAMLLRQGVLSCSPLLHSCEFVLVDPGHARLPDAAGGDRTAPGAPAHP